MVGVASAAIKLPQEATSTTHELLYLLLNLRPLALNHSKSVIIQLHIQKIKTLL